MKKIHFMSESLDIEGGDVSMFHEMAQAINQMGTNVHVYRIPDDEPQNVQTIHVYNKPNAQVGGNLFALSHKGSYLHMYMVLYDGYQISKTYVKLHNGFSKTTLYFVRENAAENFVKMHSHAKKEKEGTPLMDFVSESKVRDAPCKEDFINLRNILNDFGIKKIRIPRFSSLAELQRFQPLINISLLAGTSNPCQKAVERRGHLTDTHSTPAKYISVCKNRE